MNFLKIAVTGTFDIYNYGDHLFYLIINNELKKRKIEADLYLFSFTGRAASPGRPEVYPLSEIENLHLQIGFSGIIIGGGSIIHYKTLENLLKDNEIIAEYPVWNLFVSPTLLAAKYQIPILWNSPEVPFAFKGWESIVVSHILANTDYITVRDLKSKEYIVSISDRNVDFIPDSGFLVSSLYSKDRLDMILADIKHLQNYIIVHCDKNIQSDQWSDLIKELVILTDLGFEIVFLPLAYTNSDHLFMYDRVSTLNESKFKCIDFENSVESIVALFHGCQGYIGFSFHGAVTAYAFDKPIIAFDYSKRKKTHELFKYLNIPEYYLNESSNLAIRFLDARDKQKVSRKSYVEIVQSLDGHFNSIIEILLSFLNGNQVKTVSKSIHDNDLVDLVNYEQNKEAEFIKKERFISESYSKCYAQFVDLYQRYTTLLSNEGLNSQTSISEDRMPVNKLQDETRKKKQRVAIYFFYDKDGVVDEYIELFLCDFCKNIDRLVVVCNGSLKPDGRILFNKFTNEIIVRENKGFDAWAYKEGMQYIGWPELLKYDELILLNFTIFGPLHPFLKVFESIDKLEIDFWGLNHHYGSADPGEFNCNPFGYLPVHLQSHFIAFTSKLLKSYDFRSYWDNLPSIKDYKEAVGLHETVLTKYFTDRGYTYCAYVETSELSKFSPYPLIDFPLLTIKNCNSPIFKRKSFFLEKRHTILSGNTGIDFYEITNFLKHKQFPVNLLLKNIGRSINYQELIESMNLVRVVPTRGIESDAVLHIIDEDIILNKALFNCLEKHFPLENIIILASDINEELVQRICAPHAVNFNVFLKSWDYHKFKNFTNKFSVFHYINFIWNNNFSDFKNIANFNFLLHSILEPLNNNFSSSKVFEESEVYGLSIPMNASLDTAKDNTNNVFSKYFQSIIKLGCEYNLQFKTTKNSIFYAPIDGLFSITSSCFNRIGDFIFDFLVSNESRIIYLSLLPTLAQKFGFLTILTLSPNCVSARIVNDIYMVNNYLSYNNEQILNQQSMITDLNYQLDNLKAQYNLLVNSRSWRFTRFFRFLNTFFINLTRKNSK